jgi:hypothetical protein
MTRIQPAAVVVPAATSMATILITAAKAAIITGLTIMTSAVLIMHMMIVARAAHRSMTVATIMVINGTTTNADTAANDAVKTPAGTMKDAAGVTAAGTGGNKIKLAPGNQPGVFLAPNRQNNHTVETF